MTVVETGENQKKLVLQTHYYKASYDEIKNLYLSILDEENHNVVSVNDDYTEIYSEIPHMEVIAKIIMQDPKETSIDFYINSDFMVGAKGKAEKFIERVLAKIEAKYEFKGVSLHKEISA
ncbi:MAG: hypothetical protein IKN46_04010 [Acholeplasmatales bacterium]|nr:hypothetical protein [Acholeplasmatales bacterium]